MLFRVVHPVVKASGLHARLPGAETKRRRSVRTFVIAAALVLFAAGTSFACGSMTSASGKQSKVVAEGQTPIPAPVRLPAGSSEG